MKRIAVLALILALTTGLACGCNSGIFVEELQVSPQDSSLSDDSGTVRVSLNTGAWNIDHISIDGTDAECLYVERNGSGIPGLPPRLKDGCSIRAIRHGVLICSISRPGDKCMDINVEENISTMKRHITVHVTDGIFQKDIHITQEPGGGWVLDSITWADTPEAMETILEPRPDGLIVNNPGAEEVTLKMTVFDNCFRQVQFEEVNADKSAAPHYPDTPAEVEIPDGMLQDGSLSFSGTAVPYESAAKQLNAGLPDVVLDVKFKPGQHKYELILEYLTYSVRYTAHMKTRNGKHTSDHEGIFTSKTPTGKWYGIWTE